MSSLNISVSIFLINLIGTLAAMLVARRLPEYHLNFDSKEIIKFGLGVIATLTALVLGLLVSSTKAKYDAQNDTVKEFATQMALLDRLMSRYGPEAKDARLQIQTITRAILEQLWPQNAEKPVELSGGITKVLGDELFETISALKPKTDSQHMLKSKAQDTIINMGQIRQKLVVNSERSIPGSLLIMLGFWQAVLFAGIGLISPRNATTITVLAVCMLSVSSALFLVLELDRPFDGLVKIPDDSIRLIQAHLGE